MKYKKPSFISKMGGALGAMIEWGSVALLGWALYTGNWIVAAYAFALIVKMFIEVEAVLSDEDVRNEIIESH